MEGELSQKQRDQLGLSGVAAHAKAIEELAEFNEAQRNVEVPRAEGFYVHVQTTEPSCNWADRANKAIQENVQLKDDVKELHNIVSELTERIDYLERLVQDHGRALYDQSWLMNKMSAKVLALQDAQLK